MMVIRALFLALIPLLCIVSISSAAAPVSEMDRYSLGVDYTLRLTGHEIDLNQSHSKLKTHYLMFHYSPVPYLLLSLGAGTSTFSIENSADNNLFSGQRGISGAFALTLFSPLVLDRFRAYGGVESFYINSSRDDHNSKGVLLTPYLSLSLRSRDFLKLESGIRYHHLLASIKGPQNSSTEVSNLHPLRLFATVTLLSGDGAYIALDADISKTGELEHNRTPFEGSISLRAGFVLRHDPKFSKQREHILDHFPEYHELKERQEEMAQELK
ncbi:hypothetical protein CHISP_2293 [Chitinispirillum alkaliphilum]|nr:hypothetical protein CHISP_2293 [Chitinispirillum alkaliphilum]